MKIADTLRQEPMPEMVYSLCKLAMTHHDKDELRRLLTLGSNEEQSKTQFNQVYSFALECGFIAENDEGLVHPCFTAEELQDFRHFRYTICKSVFKESETNFTKLAVWYMSQDIPKDNFAKESVLGISSDSDFLAQIPEGYRVDGNFYNGFRFWMTALGLTSLNPPSGGRFLYAAQRVLKDWFDFEGALEPGADYPFRIFFDKLTKDLPLFSACATQNNLCTSLSMALRVLHESGIIELVHVNDAKDVWQLDSSVYYSKLNGVTDIVYKGVL